MPAHRPHRSTELSLDRPGVDVAADSAESGLVTGCTVHQGMQKLVQLLPRVTRGLRRSTAELDAETDSGIGGVTALGPRHRSALILVREFDTTVGALASALGLNLATASGLVADLERVGFVARSADPADRRRTIVSIAEERESLVDRWLAGATAPIVRALEHLSAEERSIFVKAMGFLDAELNGTE